MCCRQEAELGQLLLPQARKTAFFTAPIRGFCLKTPQKIPVIPCPPPPVAEGAGVAESALECWHKPPCMARGGLGGRKWVGGTTRSQSNPQFKIFREFCYIPSFLHVPTAHCRARGTKGVF